MDPDNAANDWLAVGDFLRDEPGGPSECPAVSVIVEWPGALDWDYYGSLGDFGALSARAVELLRPFASPCFDFVEIALNGVPYYMPKAIRRINCLDINRSQLERFDFSPHAVKWIYRYTFDTARLSGISMFAIPKMVAKLFVTAPVVDAVRQAKLRGFRFEEVYVS